MNEPSKAALDMATRVGWRAPASGKGMRLCGERDLARAMDVFAAEQTAKLREALAEMVGVYGDMEDGDGNTPPEIMRARAALGDAPQPAPNQAVTADQTVTYVLRYGGSCRDCGDGNGICPNSGLPCDSEAAAKAVRHVLSAIHYGTKNGYLPTT